MPTSRRECEKRLLHAVATQQPNPNLNLSCLLHAAFVTLQTPSTARKVDNTDRHVSSPTAFENTYRAVISSMKTGPARSLVEKQDVEPDNIRVVMNMSGGYSVHYDGEVSSMC
jgi:hypothetical protein